MKSDKYCKKIVKGSGSNFYYSFLSLPKRKRRAIFAVYAFSRTIDDVVDNDDERSTKERMLNFWRAEIEAIYSGTSKHPLTTELGWAAREFNIPKEYFIEHINGVTQDMVQTRYATFEDLKKYCYRVASIVGLICLKVFEVEDTEKNRDAAISLGLAFQLTNIIRDISADADLDRVYIPQEDLANFNLTEADILEKRFSDDFIDLVSFEWNRANEMFEKARAGFDKKASRKLLPAMIMADIYYDILVRIKDVGFNIFEHKVRVPTPRKMRMALKRFFSF